MQNAAPTGLELVHAAQVSDAPISMIVARTGQRRESKARRRSALVLDSCRARGKSSGVPTGAMAARVFGIRDGSVGRMTV
jgi:hypothetical protein